MNWWQRIVFFVFWPVVFGALCGMLLVVGFIVWIAIPFGWVSLPPEETE